MLTRISNAIIKVTEFGLWIGFLVLVVTVGLQVGVRNIFKLPLIWTLDLAQLLFSWLIFIGAAVAFRRGAHYMVDIWPEDWARFRAVLDIIAIAAAAVVIYVLIVHGWTLVDIRRTSTVASLGISHSWMFLPMPLSGGLMLIFLAEAVQGMFRKGPR
ncbi:TRAP transporter small permease [Chelativorans alearense]|uniref:TRAP transporter small permease n=1 Tax=Chelativorans alearense TaxID=2681495 RepID=UPI0013D01317|nr:TRAP transporter small permease subunit [Chelativorans alearense]